MAPLAFPYCLGLPYWHYKLVLSWYLHQPESHQLSLQKVCDGQTPGPIDQTPGIPGSDNKCISEKMGSFNSNFLFLGTRDFAISNTQTIWAEPKKNKNPVHFLFFQKKVKDNLKTWFGYVYSFEVFGVRGTICHGISSHQAGPIFKSSNFPQIPHLHNFNCRAQANNLARKIFCRKFGKIGKFYINLILAGSQPR